MAQAWPVMSQMRMMIGIGTPRSQSRQERMVPSIKRHFASVRREGSFPQERRGTAISLKTASVPAALT